MYQIEASRPIGSIKLRTRNIYCRRDAFLGNAWGLWGRALCSGAPAHEFDLLGRYVRRCPRAQDW